MVYLQAWVVNNEDRNPQRNRHMRRTHIAFGRNPIDPSAALGEPVRYPVDPKGCRISDLSGSRDREHPKRFLPMTQFLDLDLAMADEVSVDEDFDILDEDFGSVARNASDDN